MCMLGELTKKELTTEKVEGYRGWYIRNPFKTIEGLYPLNKNLEVKFNLEGFSDAILDKKQDFLNSKAGFYAYNNYNYNYYNNDYYNNYNYYNYYYNNNHYYVAGKVELQGLIAHHILGYRATKAKPSLLVKLTPKNVLDEKFNKFTEYFNDAVEKTALMYQIPTIFSEDFK